MLDSFFFGLPLDQWPEALRARATGVKALHCLAVGRLLGYCQATSATVSMTSVRSYLEWHGGRVTQTSRNREISTLRLVLPILFPADDWTWMFDLGPLRRAEKQRTPKIRAVDPRTLTTVPPDKWPSAVRAAMINAIEPQTADCRFDSILRQEKRSPGSKHVWRGIRAAYGQYLHHRRCRGEDDTITPEGVALFATDIEDRGLRPRTIATHVLRLSNLVKYAELPGDWGWLQRDAADLVFRSNQYPKLKNGRRLRHPLEIWRLGMALVQRARAKGDGSMAAAAAYRDGVMLMLAVSQPLRLKNLSGLKIGSTLVVEDGHAIRLDLPGEEMKNRRPYAVNLWPELQPILDEYIARWRPMLGRGYRGTELWLAAVKARVHPALTEKGVYKAIVARTKAEFGEQINPHLLRDIAATAMIEADPTKARLASDLLQHRSPDSIREYTEQASSVAACRAMRKAVATAHAAAQARVLGGAT